MAKSTSRGQSAAWPAASQRKARSTFSEPTEYHQIVIVGGGAGGIATAASLIRRDPQFDIAIIEPSNMHYYQPGWTLVGRGLIKPEKTGRRMADIVPEHVSHIAASANELDPERSCITLDNGKVIGYKMLVIAAGIKLDWDAIPGLVETLGKNGVTSNYSYTTAPYTWELVQQLKRGRAIFTQPPMPIKCAGAPQKAMYLSCDHWLWHGEDADVDVEFHTSGSAIFGINDYVPALEEYLKKYDITLNLQSQLIAVDGANQRATFATANGEITREFDLLHVSPPQRAPDFIANSRLADANGYADVDQHSLRHVRYSNVFALGDACSAPNAKTAAAVRTQAPIVAENICAIFARRDEHASYNGYGSCPLTVERGKVILAEFGYGGRLLPTFSKWFIHPTRPSKTAWLFKRWVLPWLYWHAMLKGREWLVQPELVPGPAAIIE